MSDPKPKSTMRRLLESGPTDPLLLNKLALLEELQEAHAKGDQKTMLEIGQKLAVNDAAFDQTQTNRRARIKKAMAAAKSVADPEERTKALLSAFQFCVKEACAADEESRDIPTYNFGVKRLCEISDELKALGRFSALAQFLDSPDIEVRGFAAVWVRDLWPERILPILKEINKTEGFGTPVGTQVYIAMCELERAKEKAAAGQKEPGAKP
ncbi:MAG TPA: hypothetical protein VGL83_21855 [Stellaceae bacterium]|jgi:hypothetical protein